MKPSQPPTVTRTNINFDAGHRLLAHEGMCASLHGHGYKLAVTCRTKTGLDVVGRVVDFSVIKKVIGSWIDENLDHTMILNREDPAIPHVEAIYRETLQLLRKRGHLRPKDFYRTVHVVDFEPTSENLAQYIGVTVNTLLKDWHDSQPVGTPAVEATRVVLWETRNCYATWRL
jgi:6-pyruvoyltetrahydropterin/6-carboxytetrahydropterin synthase